MFRRKSIENKEESIEKETKEEVADENTTSGSKEELETASDERDTVTDAEEVHTEEDEITIEEDEVSLDEDEVHIDDESEENEENSGLELYVLVDKKIKNLERAMFDNGVNVNRIVTSIEDMNRELLISANNKRIVVIETGTGKFSSTEARKQIVDTLGILDDSDRVTFIYSEELIYESVKDGLKRHSFKSIDWTRYRSTIEAIRYIKGYKEEYTGKYKQSNEKNGKSLNEKCRSHVEMVSTDRFRYRGSAISKFETQSDDNNIEENIKYEY